MRAIVSLGLIVVGMILLCGAAFLQQFFVTYVRHERLYMDFRFIGLFAVLTVIFGILWVIVTLLHVLTSKK